MFGFCLQKPPWRQSLASYRLWCSAGGGAPPLGKGLRRGLWSCRRQHRRLGWL